MPYNLKAEKCRCSGAQQYFTAIIAILQRSLHLPVAFFIFNFYIALHTQPCFVGASRGMHFKREIFGTGPCQDFYFFRDNLSDSVVYVYTVVVQLQSTTKKIYVSRQKWLKKVERDVLLERHKLLGRQLINSKQFFAFPKLLLGLEQFTFRLSCCTGRIDENLRLYSLLARQHPSCLDVAEEPFLRSS